jgi:hypothetical protein
MATIQGIYIALFGRPADPAGLAFFNAETNNGADLTAIGDLAATDEYQDRFTGLSNAEIINSIYQSLFGRDGEQDGIDFFVAALEDGTYNINNIAIAILDGAQGDDLATVNAKIAAANIFTAALDQDFEVDAYSGPDAAALARDFIDTVTIDDAGTQEEADAVIANIVNQSGNEPPAPGGGEGGNFAPVAGGDSYSVDEEGILNGASVLGNDVDAEGSPLTAVLTGTTSNGTLVFNADGTFTYTPGLNFNGSDSFTYRANDGEFNSNEVTVNITVNPMPDPVSYTLNAPQTSAGQNLALDFTGLQDVAAGEATVELVITARGDLGGQYSIVDGILGFNSGNENFTVFVDGVNVGTFNSSNDDFSIQHSANDWTLTKTLNIDAAYLADGELDVVIDFSSNVNIVGANSGVNVDLNYLAA